MTDLSFWLIIIDIITSPILTHFLFFSGMGFAMILVPYIGFSLDKDEKEITKRLRPLLFIIGTLFVVFSLLELLIPSKDTLMVVLSIEVLDEVASQIAEHTELPEKSLKTLDLLLDRLNEYLGGEIPTKSEGEKI